MDYNLVKARAGINEKCTKQVTCACGAEFEPHCEFHVKLYMLRESLAQMIDKVRELSRENTPSNLRDLLIEADTAEKVLEHYGRDPVRAIVLK